MSVIIISDREQFLRMVQSPLKSLCRNLHVECLSGAEWEARDLSQTGPGTWILADPQLPAFAETGPAKPTVEIWSLTVRRHPGERESAWEQLTMDGYLLQLHHRSRNSGLAGGIRTETLLDSPRHRIRTIRMPPRRSLVAAVRDEIIDSVRRFSLLTREREALFGTALVEGLSNALFHGSLEVPSALRDEDTGAFWRRVAEREAQAPWCDRTVRITEVVSHDGAWITVHDQGPGFDVHRVLSGSTAREPGCGSGRGLIMMKACTDDLYFNDSGTEVCLVTYRVPEPRSRHNTLREAATALIG